MTERERIALSDEELLAKACQTLRALSDHRERNGKPADNVHDGHAIMAYYMTHDRAMLEDKVIELEQQWRDTTEEYWLRYYEAREAERSE